MSRCTQEPEVPNIATLCTIIDSFAGRESTAIYSLQEQGVRLWCYTELLDHVLQLARGLSNLGVRKSQRIALLAFSRPETIVAALAVLKAGAAVVPIDAQLGMRTLEFMLADSEASMAFVTEDYLLRFEALAIAQKLRLIVLDGNETSPRH